LLNFFKKDFKIVIVLIALFLSIPFISTWYLPYGIRPGTIEGSLSIADSGSINNLKADDVNIYKKNKNSPGSSRGVGLKSIPVEENFNEEELIIEEKPEETPVSSKSAEQEEQNHSNIGEGEEMNEVDITSTGDDNMEIDFRNSDDFRIEVDLSAQKVFIFYEGNPIREMICSGGTEEKPTPAGEFKTTRKGDYFWSDKYNVGAYYWVRFYNEYLFHSVPFDAEGQMIKEEFEKLGSPASHGCIRLGLEDARWVYDMLPTGIKVLVY